MSPSSYQTAPPRNNKGANYRVVATKGQPWTAHGFCCPMVWGQKNANSFKEPPFVIFHELENAAGVCVLLGSTGPRRTVRRKATTLPLAIFHYVENAAGVCVLLKQNTNLVPKRGLEPPRGFPHYPLKVACLPISPLRHKGQFNYRVFLNR